MLEANATTGGGARSAELTLPSFIHDICSAVHPLAASSPFFSQLPLQKYGLEFIYPPMALAHPFDDGHAIVLGGSVEATAARLGVDGDAYRKLLHPIVEGWDLLVDDLLGPPRFPKHPLRVAQFGRRAIRSAKAIAESHFREDKTRAVFAGLAAHSFLSLDRAGSAAFGMILAAMTHTVGWPIARGGSQNISNALANYLRDLGGEITANHRVESLNQLPPAKAVLCDLTPRQLVQVSSGQLPQIYIRKMRRYRYGPGAFKMDWALSSPVPWKAKECLKAATVHLGGAFEEILESERLVAAGKHPELPFVILSQPSLFDSSRAPKEQHTLWGYCHVPNGSKVDMSERIEKQIERFAPGFRDCILARRVSGPSDLEHHNANLVGGDINGGLQNLGQMFTRPTWRLYATPKKHLYLCSSSTPPGGGVHGLCGYFAAKLALRKSF